MAKSISGGRSTFRGPTSFIIMKIENRIYSFEEVKQSFLTYISNKDDIDRIEKAYKFAEKNMQVKKENREIHI